MKFQHVTFITTVVQAEKIPFFRDLPEIAVAGRSNVGKSTLLNHLFGVKKLVKTSSTPGKTRALNFFNVDGKFIAVDMPGYGFANVSKEEKKSWASLVNEYLNTRTHLKALLFLFDIRRDPSNEDMHMLEWIRHCNIPTILILTKVDKVNTKERAAQTKRITGIIKDLPYVHYSATKNEGRKELIAQLRELMNGNA